MNRGTIRILYKIGGAVEDGLLSPDTEVVAVLRRLTGAKLGACSPSLRFPLSDLGVVRVPSNCWIFSLWP